VSKDLRNGVPINDFIAGNREMRAALNRILSRVQPVMIRYGDDFFHLNVNHILRIRWKGHPPAKIIGALVHVAGGEIIELGSADANRLWRVVDELDDVISMEEGQCV